MLDRPRAGSSPAWLRAAAPLLGAAIALAIGGWLTVLAIDYARNGCECNDALRPDWLWIPLLGLAIVCYAVALALVMRKVASAQSEL
jgi:hypothetical protein